MRKGRMIAVIWPGIGYHCDKPLLYYSKKMMTDAGYEIREVPYKGFPYGVKDDPKIMEEALAIGLLQAEEILSDIDWDTCEHPVFISKSIGTVIAARYAKEHHLQPFNIYQTPLELLFDDKAGRGIAFHGTGDTWANTENLKQLCEAAGIELHLIPDADHSLETGDIVSDIEIVADVIEISKDSLPE